ncbi:hypothetical protein GCM10010094_50100 [Streptomyces flaveus]|uniref:Uncharacterized protein n=1 Tax=Streptomyces flaveus TaxID=66370 RepID=A0A917VIR5_9ACTN|nr:hypothetical protein GCM10010094_50100 [Streptomyces flaveus]
MGPTAVQEGHEHGHQHRGAAHEDSRNRRFRGAFGGEHGEVEADHADGREQREPYPLPCGQPAQGRHAATSDQGQEQQAGEAVAQELAARVRVFAQDAVGGEGASDEDAGQGGEQGAAGGDVHGGDAMDTTGPV